MRKIHPTCGECGHLQSGVVVEEEPCTQCGACDWYECHEPAFSLVRPGPGGWWGVPQRGRPWGRGPFGNEALARAVRFGHTPGHFICGSCGIEVREEDLVLHCQQQHAPCGITAVRRYAETA